MPKLESFISQLLAIVEPLIFPRDPRPVRFRHGDVFSHLQFRSESERVISKLFRKIDISISAMGDRQISEASRLNYEVAAAPRHFKSRLKMRDCLSKISTKKINQAES